MDFAKATTITIAFDALQDLLAERTGNPIANEEIPEILRTAIQSGTKVLLTDGHGNNAHQLNLGPDGQFTYVSVA
jgi:hypothetical protein